MLSNGAAFLFSNLVAYLINIYWVFVPGRHHWIVEVGLFYLVSGTAIGRRIIVSLENDLGKIFAQLMQLRVQSPVHAVP